MASTVLIVEDDPHTVEVVRLYLRRDGHTVLTASNGKDGLRVAQESAPDLVVLDLMLPEMGGLEVCRELRKESDVPIVMLTARGRGGRPRSRVRTWGRRLRNQAIQPPGVGGPDTGGPPADSPGPGGGLSR